MNVINANFNFHPIINAGLVSVTPKGCSLFYVFFFFFFFFFLKETHPNFFLKATIKHPKGSTVREQKHVIGITYNRGGKMIIN